MITLSRWLSFVEPFEGHTTWLYLDSKGLVTIGDGNLVDSIASLSRLRFHHLGPFSNDFLGAPATDQEVAAYWLLVHSRQDLKGIGGFDERFLTLSDIRATEESIEGLIYSQMGAFEGVLERYFPDFERWPEDAQLATLSMAWALGPHFPQEGWPRFVAACRVQDWATAALECKMSEVGQPKQFVKRNEANRKLFEGI